MPKSMDQRQRLPEGNDVRCISDAARLQYELLLQGCEPPSAILRMGFRAEADRIVDEIERLRSACVSACRDVIAGRAELATLVEKRRATRPLELKATSLQTPPPEEWPPPPVLRNGAAGPVLPRTVLTNGANGNSNGSAHAK
jgi:hypothetical protein